MSVSNGQPANEISFNDAFLSRTDNSSAAGEISFTNVTESTSPSTGAFTMDGGLGVAKNLNVGGVFKATQMNGTIKTYGEQLILGGGTINFETNQSIQYRRIAGSGGPQTINALPFGSNPTLPDGATFILMGMDDTNNIRINHNDLQYGTLLFGDAILKRGFKLTVTWDAVLERFIEDGRNF